MFQIVDFIDRHSASGLFLTIFFCHKNFAESGELNFSGLFRRINLDFWQNLADGFSAPKII